MRAFTFFPLMGRQVRELRYAVLFFIGFVTIICSRPTMSKPSAERALRRQGAIIRRADVTGPLGKVRNITSAFRVPSSE